MPSALLFVTYLLIASFSLHTLAVFLYFHDRHSSELRWAAMIMFSLGAISLALASLVWMEIHPTAKTAVLAPPHAYAVSVGKN